MPISSARFEQHGLPAVRFGDGIVLIDTANDSYSCFYEPLAEETGVTLPDSRSTIASSNNEQLELCTTGEPWRELPAAGNAGLRLRDIVRFAAALLIATIDFHRRDFQGLLDGPRRRPGHASFASEPELAQIITRFERMSLFLPVRIQCLFRSFFLLQFLATYGYSADWIFGATLFPFRAHCWLASGKLLLGETIGRAIEYSPLLVVAASGR